jgi:D-glycero-D-manno-heptose 1,7-bisphosphate phosphatase
MNSQLTPALFLDRDGVIIQNRPDYIRRWSQVHFFPWALEALACLESSPWRVVIITNQSCIGRRLVSAEMVDDINRRLVDRIESQGGRVDGIYVCPHAPQAGCYCRKPQPGMLLQAAVELNLDLHQSVLVGDALEDLGAGRAAGVARVALVRTGRGAEHLRRPEAADLKPFAVFDRFDVALVEMLGLLQPGLPPPAGSA